MKKEMEQVLKEISLPSPLKNYENKLDNIHLHVFVVTVKRHRFPSLFIMEDVSGKKLLNLSVENPFDREPCIYKLSSNVPEPLLEFYTEFFGGVDVISSGIFRTPLRVKVLRSVGDETWLQKIFLRERVKGEEFFTFQQRVSDENLEKLLRVVRSNLRLILKNEGIDVFLDVPPWVKEDHITLIHEIGVLLRKKEGIQPAQNPMGQAFLSLRIPYDRFFERNFNLESFVKNFLENVRKIYEILVSML
ncbi:DUF4895 domain-containing protein [Thermotoga sp. KOL6]|uniref:DUF4895 domain-containing protein n=1 Tax=Thermotoga sp. KOL6 TaxID=126741 RepID=UPI000C7821BA|nr:DUF4895 domain-containing protein [Thermotoga sp. KOL6]PLV59732.1 hypothetical protein AS005_00050 [Thermotoga sp. KOL6]